MLRRKINKHPQGCCREGKIPKRESTQGTNSRPHPKHRRDQGVIALSAPTRQLGVKHSPPEMPAEHWLPMSWLWPLVSASCSPRGPSQPAAGAAQLGHGAGVLSQPREVLAYSCQRPKEEKKSYVFLFVCFYLCFGKFCPGKPLSVVALLPFSKPEAAW